MFVVGIMLTAIVVMDKPDLDIDVDFTESKVSDRPLSGKRLKTARPMWLFRGQPRSHKNADGRFFGVITPLCPETGHYDILKHRDGDTRSKVSSWTSNIGVACIYAKMDMNTGCECDGDIFAKLFMPNEYIMYDVNDFGSGDIYNENEYLVEGIITGCIVIPVTGDINENALRRKVIEEGWNIYN